MRSTSSKRPQPFKHIPQRTCIACREVKPKRQLLRLVYTGGGVAEVDLSGKISGRGAYLCPSPDCWEKGLKEGRLAQALRRTISTENQARLREFGKTFCSQQEER